MASTLTKILIHVTFSTKNRAALIPATIESDLYAYIGGICRRMQSPLLAMNGTADHVHMLISLGKTVALSDLMLEVKRDSSKWIKEKETASEEFGWQSGYFAFSIGESGEGALRAYIANKESITRPSTSKMRSGRSFASMASIGMNDTFGSSAKVQPFGLPVYPSSTPGVSSPSLLHPRLRTSQPFGLRLTDSPRHA